jgi:hypothetical protein
MNGGKIPDELRVLLATQDGLSFMQPVYQICTRSTLKSRGTGNALNTKRERERERVVALVSCQQLAIAGALNHLLVVSCCDSTSIARTNSCHSKSVAQRYADTLYFRYLDAC